MKSYETLQAVDYTDARRQMVTYQLVARGIGDPAVLAAMGEVPRELFVPSAHQPSAYADGALPIEHGQTISQPYTVACMCEAAAVQPEDRVLEVGTGSGYGAAVLSRIAKEVFTVERIAELAAAARARLQNLAYNNVRVCVSDGSLGWKEESPYDAIIVTAGAERLPDAYIEQLADGGRIVIPIGQSHYSQTMYCYTRQGKELTRRDIGRFMFVPLIGEQGWSKGTHLD